ncbi:hypothetical protein ACFWP5_11595 [Streptomyces sp. NPDC058469]|uniref:hypothetical protein n=1 Tax=Streptomyces sp. NPDC058469 TaxID=3346514 RepID=UPI00366726E2
MTHDPEHEAGDSAATPPMPDHVPEWEVLTGPGGAERDRGLDRLWRQRSRRARAVIAVATVGVLALGGTVAYAATSGSPGGDAVPAAGSPSGTTPPGGPGFRHGGGGGFGLGGAAVHGEATVKDNATGKWVVRIWQRGTVTKVDGDQVTVKSDDGTSWTWTVGSGVTAQGSGALKKGDTASLTGTRSNAGTRTADRAFTGTLDRKGPSAAPNPPDSAPTHAPSPSGSGATTRQAPIPTPAPAPPTGPSPAPAPSAARARARDEMGRAAATPAAGDTATAAGAPPQPIRRRRYDLTAPAALTPITTFAYNSSE